MFDVITVGTATRDAFVKSKEFYVEREGHVTGGKELAMPFGAKIEIEKIVFTTGGGATNTAVTFARQGFKTAAIAVVGDDVSGQAVIEGLKKERVSTSLVRKNKDVATAYSILLHPKEGGERTVLVYRGASETLSHNDIRRSRPRTKWFYVSSLAGNLRLLENIIFYAKKTKSFIAYNPGGKELAQKRRLLPLLMHTDLLIANREEASLITGIPYANTGEIFKKWDRISPGINVLTDARRGVLVSDGTRLYQAGIYKEKKIVDRTGAGDAFGSGFTASLIDGLRATPHISLDKLPIQAIVRAIRLGSANATAKVEGVGAKYGLLTKSEFLHQARWRALSIRITHHKTQ